MRLRPIVAISSLVCSSISDMAFSPRCLWNSTRLRYCYLGWATLKRIAQLTNSEWIKGLLAVPFVLHSQPTGVFESRSNTVEQMAEQAHRRYAEIMQDVEDMIDDHSELLDTH